MEAPIFLAQSDTTAGFLCENFNVLNHIKGRNVKQNVLLTLESLEKLKKLVRVPNAHKNRVRRSQKKTFVYKGRNVKGIESLAIRLVPKGIREKVEHSNLLAFFPFLYSSSANAHKAEFDLDFALEKADIVVLDWRFLSAQKPSKMYKIVNARIRKIR
ncbi:hypothetical protein [Helicobacter turcicus]|uniref:Sua5 YciO YrdC YwlC family protein n=1 Tax=Helicobacter turcicus TaxID=2867412 RepID=A0ABS7JPQ4_9HELI|nr:hypothetical protein [Helicobacter turcicus]MBX7491386.1 hypothetical protein [Helicobacter turcicus]MBX7546253.1 hypothetical protein [Helicobacter turcicus]